MRGVGLLAAMLVFVNFVSWAGVWAEGFSDASSVAESVPSFLVSQQTAHDVSVINVIASTSSVSQGDVVTVNVAAQNLGFTAVTFDMNLRDDTDRRDIASVSVTLEPSQTIILGLPWNTGGASGGAHLLTASAHLDTDENPGNNTMTIAAPITVVLMRIVLGDARGLNKPQAYFGTSLISPNIVMQAPPQSVLFIGGNDASFGRSLSRAAVTTDEASPGSVYVANADATFQPVASFQNPFQQGEVRGVVHLEGQRSSSGAYVAVGQAKHFVGTNGSFQFLLPNGTYDLLVQSPGYVPVKIPVASINPGEVVSIPELTLPFGDANGDGRIDILDLSIAAGNFGATVTEMAVP